MQVHYAESTDPAVRAMLGLDQQTTPVETATPACEESKPSKYQPAIRSDNPANGYFGTIKSRATFQLIVNKVLSFETRYGTKYLVLFEDREGNKAIWWASREPKWAYDAEGCWATVKATPKAHDTHDKYGNQTVLLRVNDET